MAPKRYTTVPGQLASRQIISGVAATDSTSTPRAAWWVRKLTVAGAKMTQTTSSTRTVVVRVRRHWPGAVPASSMSGHTLTAAPAPISTPRTSPFPATHRAATASASDITSNLVTVIAPSNGTAHTQYQAPATDPPRRAREHSMSVMARSQPIARTTKPVR